MTVALVHNNGQQFAKPMGSHELEDTLPEVWEELLNNIWK